MFCCFRELAGVSDFFVVVVLVAWPLNSPRVASWLAMSSIDFFFVRVSFEGATMGHTKPVRGVKSGRFSRRISSEVWRECNVVSCHDVRQTIESGNSARTNHTI